ncbi:MAG: hypothetical protein IKL33_00415 [Alphaproteobacteria bacterium]|nr:hypothetical protein [Alphaproteobacteria bacterium]
MAYNFEKERNEVLQAAKDGIRGNLKLNGKQKKYVKNLLLFALMRASSNGTVTPKNFLKLVNKLFKESLLKIIAEGDDDDEDWDEALDVELNNIIASDEMLKQIDFDQLLTPENISMFLKGATKGVSQTNLVKKLLAMRDAKANYRETPDERKERVRRQKQNEMLQQQIRGMMMERGGRGSHERG